MKSTFRITLALLAILTSPCAAVPNAWASDADNQQATALADARAIIVASKVERTMDAMFSQLQPAMELSFIGEVSGNSEGQALLETVDSKYPGGRAAFGKRFGELFLKGMRAKYPEMIDSVAKLYASELSSEDLAAIRAFYESPTGVRLLATLPQMQKQLSEVGQKVGMTVGIESAKLLISEAEKYVGKVK